jgi:hypothetical protein
MEKWDEAIRINEEDKGQYQSHLRNLRSPFGWMNKDDDDAESEISTGPRTVPPQGTPAYAIY